ncbi:uncharacterized protein BDR25DRAFT_363176 [Lindgomyces ingoldianus]|uniref:Uncharacterized protein n=1 Tax=Lindgomyces ingoldianus TaxID=673940 RepID=A0ACB6Q886_9PLEO|nr:uncharacterized protein BDR25DRAFT_363176 [Lindgomyces ingoldianus]KAF2463089.1 hypothetical protein BDR25DRAFT_363176 [Lindgomyces ingoldianus]
MPEQIVHSFIAVLMKSPMSRWTYNSLPRAHFTLAYIKYHPNLPAIILRTSFLVTVRVVLTCLSKVWWSSAPPKARRSQFSQPASTAISLVVLSLVLRPPTTQLILLRLHGIRFFQPPAIQGVPLYCYHASRSVCNAFISAAPFSGTIMLVFETDPKDHTNSLAEYLRSSLWLSFAILTSFQSYSDEGSRSFILLNPLLLSTPWMKLSVPKPKGSLVGKIPLCPDLAKRQDAKRIYVLDNSYRDAHADVERTTEYLGIASDT